MSVVHWLEERRDLQWTSLCICLSKLPHSIFLIPRTLWVHSVLSWWLSHKKAWSSHRLEVRDIATNSACLMPVPDSPRTSQAPKERLWYGPRVNSQRLDKCALSTPQSFATQGRKCRIRLVWHMLPGSHRILEYLYLFYNLIVYL